LKRDPAVRLDKYRQNRERQRFALKKVQLDMQRLATEAQATTLHDELLEQVHEKSPGRGPFVAQTPENSSSNYEGRGALATR
jgi:hypothetical protein